MTPSARATALTLAVLAGVVAFLIAAVVAYYAALREPAPRPAVSRHLRVTAHRHRLARRHEWLPWLASAVARFVRYEDGGPKLGVVFAGLFLAFSVLIGASQ